MNEYIPMRFFVGDEQKIANKCKKSGQHGTKQLGTHGRVIVYECVYVYEHALS